jgi:hypothetical protein
MPAAQATPARTPTATTSSAVSRREQKHVMVERMTLPITFMLSIITIARRRFSDGTRRS